jgi:hypothetical protein
MEPARSADFRSCWSILLTLRNLIELGSSLFWRRIFNEKLQFMGLYNATFAATGKRTADQQAT